MKVKVLSSSNYSFLPRVSILPHHIRFLTLKESLEALHRMDKYETKLRQYFLSPGGWLFRLFDNKFLNPHLFNFYVTSGPLPEEVHKQLMSRESSLLIIDLDYKLMYFLNDGDTNKFDSLYFPLFSPTYQQSASTCQFDYD